VRIIAGRFRGKQIHSLKIPNLRPTLGRVKETFFAIIENHVVPSGMRALDIFAGTGNLGLEALSRGAADVTFVENNRESLSIIGKNIADFGVEGCTSVITADVFDAVERLAAGGRRFDLIIMDPPFRNDYLNRVIGETRIDLILDDEGMIACETEKKYSFKNNEKWDIIRERKIADSTLWFLKKRS